MLQFPAGTHKWVIDDICDMLEEHPEYENMSEEDLAKKRNDLYWEAQGCFDRGNRLESDGDTIERYIEIRKEMGGGDKVIKICQWCFEEPALKGKTVCQACIDAESKPLEENKDFDLDKWLEETDEEVVGDEETK